MGYVRGRFGLEYDASRKEPETPWLRWIVTTVIALVLVSLAVRAVRRLATPPPEEFELAAPTAPATPEPTADAKPPPPAAPARPAADRSAANKPAIIVDATNRRADVRSLLAKIETARRKDILEMEVAAIERLRSLPGNPAADLDDALAQRLGELNLKWLFGLKGAQWTREVEVRRGDSATRIARSFGTTLGSLEKLNGDVSKLRIGQRLTVMNHPHFSLAVYRLTKVADLSLNGKFFKRYRLAGPVTGESGAYATSERLRTFFGEKGVVFSPEDRAELELLMPTGTPVTISEFK